jgi:DNA-directed RNA polymerase subunit RPC12/RpoP
MQDHVDELPVVRCPGCHHPMQPKERTLATGRLVDIRYVCVTCGMETKRTVAEQA